MSRSVPAFLLVPKRLLVVSGLVLLLSPMASAQTLHLDEQFGFQRSMGVVFASKAVGSPPVLVDLRLELYEPTGVGVPSNRPALVAIHGGGFTGGSRLSGFMLEICERMAMRGYTCISIDYRLQGQNPVVGSAYQTLEALLALSDPGLAQAIAAATEDTVAALEWLDQNAATLDIDPSRIGLAGYSAGGVLTAITAYVADDAGVLLPSPVRATYNISGGVDLAGTLGPGEAPVILSHGDQDTVVPIAGAYALRDAAALAGVPNQLHVLAGRGHTDFDIFSDEVAPGETVFESFVSFFFVHVAGAAATPVPALAPLARALLVGALFAAGFAVRSRARLPGPKLG